MPFTLSSLPAHAFRDLLEMFWGSVTPASVTIQLQSGDELPWQTQWMQGELPFGSELVSEGLCCLN